MKLSAQAPAASVAALAQLAGANGGRVPELPAEPAGHTFILPPSAFAQTTQSIVTAGVQAPRGPVKLGLRTLSAEDNLLVTKASILAAEKLYPKRSHDDPVWIGAANEYLMLGCVERALVKPDNRHQPFWQHPSLSVRYWMTKPAIERAFDELEMFTVADGIVRPEIDDEECVALGAALTDGSFWQDMSAKTAHRVRKALAYALELSREET